MGLEGLAVFTEHVIMICNSTDMTERNNISIQFTQTMFVSHRCGSKIETCFLLGGAVDKVSICCENLFSKIIMNMS